MNELTDRQKFILTLVIHDYVMTANPVGSNYLVKEYQLGMSSATIRNEMSALTERGYLFQPHTSAGRQPSEEGYRFFISSSLEKAELPENTRRTITHQFYQMHDDVDQWMRLAASVLARQSQVASLVTAPHPEDACLKHLELISTHGAQVLMILVLIGGDIHQRILRLAEPVPQEQLSSVADQATKQYQGADIKTLLEKRPVQSGLEQEVIDMVIDEMSTINDSVAGEVYLDGITNLLSEPEFTASEEVRRSLRIFEERSLLQDLLERTILTNNTDRVQVLIGGDGLREELRQCSVVLARYGVPGLATGTLGILGPMRMSYGRSISTIRFLSGLLSNLMTETLAE
jgi:heat-inducible transcriptional repressor